MAAFPARVSVFPVIVVGGGLAGLSAAVRLGELGVRSIVLEAGTAEDYLCNSRLAMGFINVAFHDVREPPAQLRAAIDHATGGAADPALADVLANEAAPALAWLRSLGVRTIVGNWRPGSAAMLAPPAGVGPGLSWRGRGADRMLRMLEAQLRRRGGLVRRGARVRRLLMDGNRCAGIEADVDGHLQQLEASAVIIADGGSAGDLAALGKCWPAPSALLQRNAGSARGDGAQMVAEAGGAVSRASGFYGHVHHLEALQNRRLWPYPTCDHLCGGGILIAETGRRFADEGRGGIYLANAIARLPSGERCFAIFDHHAWMTRCTSFPLPANPLLASVGATIHSAASVADLATRIRVPADALGATVAAYNAALASGTASTLDPPRTGHAYAPLPVATAPLHAVPLVAGITYTTGGIHIDADCRVLDTSGVIIPGLLAAGSATGGHEDGATGGYTGGLSKALVFGKRAGETAATSIAANEQAAKLRIA